MTTIPDWWRLGLAVSARDEDVVTEALGALGLDAIEIVAPGPDAEGGPAAGELWIHVYVEPDARDAHEAALAALAGTLDGARLLATTPISRDAWSGIFEPVRVGSFALRAVGDDGPSLGEAHVVWIHPGMGFGAGEHPTTRVALAVLERAMTPGARVIDVGAGTGVLALAAQLLGARRAVAVDLAPDARRACAENAALNG
ncbi:50S ribosomal protein L11 methyltransferase, partial [Myxococcota bacterium]|nr:50S ribosomal protein L11 methyltransferase [Myxococcota bacterium]